MSAVKKVEAAEPTPLELISHARTTFGKMQRSWWEFAKVIHKIRTEQTWSKAVLGPEDGFESFKEFCQHEFPTIDQGTLYKFCLIVEDWHDVLEARLKKDPNFKLPAYEACYRLLTAREQIAKEDLSRLRKQIMDTKVSYTSLREQLKDLISRKLKSVTRSTEEVEESVRKIESDLATELRGEDLEDADMADFSEPESDFDDHDDEDLMDEESDDDTDGVVSCIARSQYLIDNLPAVEILLKSGSKKTKELVELAGSLEKLSDIANNFFTKYEKLK